jgi:putative N6-adenine-specific DNA methylase
MHSIFTASQPIVVSCPPHIVPYLKEEILAQGFPIEEESMTTVHTNGTFNDTIKLNLTLRTANHVYLLINKFLADSVQQLYDEVKKVEWEEIIPENGFFSVHTVAEHEDKRCDCGSIYGEN